MVDTEGNLSQLEGREHPPLGAQESEPRYTPAQLQLHSGERLILVTNGIVKRRTEDGGLFGVDGLQRAIERAQSPTAAATAMAIQEAVTDCWREPLEDDATVVVMAIE